jgi:integrase
LNTSDKKTDTLVTERGHINKWVKAIGHLRLAKILPHHITSHLHGLRRAKKSARTCNLSLTSLRNVLKSARIDGHLKASPADGLQWFKTEKKAHRLYSPDQINRLCDAARSPRYFEGRLAKVEEKGARLKNCVQFVDYIRFLQYSGAREQEALRIRWQDVDLDQGHVMIGAEGDSKNREARAVDLNPQLRQSFEDMATRKAPDSQWLFPSPQRGDRDKHARTFRESLLLAREAAGLPDFGFHDLRRFFASRSIMSGIDVLTVSRWLGHKDGGLLLLKSYAHLANEHRKAQAQRIVFAPQIVNGDTNAAAGS